MDLQEATAILKRPKGDLHEWSAAGACVTSFYNQHPDKLRPAHRTNDRMTAAQRHRSMSPEAKLDMLLEYITRKPAMKRSVRDQIAGTEPDPESTSGSQTASTKVGARLIMTLPGPTSAYFIAADGDGKACLYRSADVTGVGDPGETTVEALTADRAAAEKSKLHEINRAHKEFWRR